MRPSYLHDWAESGRDGVRDCFEISEADLAGAEILLADYTYEDNSGDAFVLFRRDGKLYEVHGAHCSCFGLEGQWEPEETTVEALRLQAKRRPELGWVLDASQQDRSEARMSTTLEQDDPRFVRRYERLLRPRDGGLPFTEFFEREDHGECGQCGESVFCVVNSSFTLNTDRTRYRYPEDVEGWCVFRCRGCGEVISDTWRPSDPMQSAQDRSEG